MAEPILTSTYYMDRSDKHHTEKPYELKFPPPAGFPATNTTWSKHDNIPVIDIRGNEADYSVERHGFQVSRLHTALAPGDFRNVERVESVFLGEAADCLKRVLGADRVLVFDYTVRMSPKGYPVSDGKPLSHQTPATIVHIDTTNAWANFMNSNYQESIDGIASKTRFQYVNIWKPINGPVKRWPLMLCDWNTYNPETDVIARDLVYTDGQLESFVGLYSPQHKYHYLRDQQNEEVWIMIQHDSTHGKGVLHSAFPSPLTVESDPERESIEVRCMVYYDE